MRRITIGDLRARDLGQTVRIFDLHSTDWNEPKVTREGKLQAIHTATPGKSCRVVIDGRVYHEVLTLDHPCEVSER